MNIIENALLGVVIFFLSIVMFLVYRLKFNLDELRREVSILDEKTDKTVETIGERMNQQFSELMNALRILVDDVDKLSQKMESREIDDAEETLAEGKTALSSELLDDLDRNLEEVLVYCHRIDEKLADLNLGYSVSEGSEKEKNSENLKGANVMTDQDLYSKIKNKLETIAEDETITVTALAESIQAEYYRVARAIDQLEQDGFLERMENTGEYRIIKEEE
jgi:predicted transcriptional regulator